MLPLNNLRRCKLINILILSGSPVEQSSTDFLLKQLADTIQKELQPTHAVQAEFVKLNDLNFIPCQSCGKAPTPKFCFYDDLAELYEKFLQADCILVGSPLYFDTVSAQAKLFIDRCNCFRPPDYDNIDPEHEFIKLIKHKRPGAMVLVGGEKGWFEGARRVIAGFFKWVEIVLEGVIIYHSIGYEPGSARTDKHALAEIHRVGIKLANQLKQKHA